jgi:hypothetical protein
MDSALASLFLADLNSCKDLPLFVTEYRCCTRCTTLPFSQLWHCATLPFSQLWIHTMLCTTAAASRTVPSMPCSNGPLSRQNDFLFITAFLHISGFFSGPNRFFPKRYQSQIDMSMPCSNGPPSRQNDFLFITAFLHTLGCFSGPNRLSPLDFCIGPRWLRLVHCKYNRNGICSAMAVLLDA